MEKEKLSVEPTITVYICSTDWSCELGETEIEVYPSIKSLLDKKGCIRNYKEDKHHCMIMEIECTLKKVINPKELENVDINDI